MCGCGHQLTFDVDTTNCSGCEKSYIKVKGEVSRIFEEGRLVKQEAAGYF